MKQEFSIEYGNLQQNANLGSGEDIYEAIRDANDVIEYMREKGISTDSIRNENIFVIAKMFIDQKNFHREFDAKHFGVHFEE